MPLPPRMPASLDANAGNWKPILLTKANEIPLLAPAEMGSGSYTTELQELKSIMAAASAEQKQAVNYWNRGGVLRHCSREAFLA